MKKACKTCRTHKIKVCFVLCYLIFRKEGANNQIKCFPEYHILKSRMKRVVARQSVAFIKSPEMLLNQIENKIVTPIALSTDPSGPTFTSEEWEQPLANSFDLGAQFPPPYFPTELESEKERLWHHSIKGLDEMLEFSSNEVTFLDVNNGFGIEAQAAMLPILPEFPRGLDSQIVSNPS